MQFYEYDIFAIVLLSGLLFWLRATIDQQKGALLETLAVTAPIALHGALVYLDNPTIEWTRLGFRLTPTVVFVFFCLPALSGVRFTERMLRGEQPQLSDLFRLTTFTGMATFVIQKLEISPRAAVFVTLMTLSYLVGELLRNYGRPGRRVSLYVVTAVAFIAIDVYVRILRLSPPPRELPWVMELRLPVLLGLLSAPLLWHSLVDRSWLLGRLGWWLQVVRHQSVRPSDAMNHRTLFRLWRFRPGVCYLNHGSFGAVPFVVQRAQQRWQAQFQAEPMDLLARQTEPAWSRARDHLAYWLGSRPENMALCENATVGMNEIASWFPLAAGQEVLLTDHEYGAVKRIWQRRAERSGASVRYANLPLPVDDPQQLVDAIINACNERTRLVVFSHITSPTAIILPVAQLCAELRARNIASCIDGPHALLQERIHLERLECDFYTASCHKWLCAPLGSGLVYVHPRWHERVEPLRLSWGRLPPAKPQSWVDELTWIGTRDYTPYLTIPTAIQFFSQFQWEWLDSRNHHLACYARRTLGDLLGTQPLVAESRELLGWMAGVWLPSGGKAAGDFSGLQDRLWQRYRIEVPIMRMGERYLVRVSCHLYNTTGDVDLLARALARELR